MKKQSTRILEMDETMFLIKALTYYTGIHQTKLSEKEIKTSEELRKILWGPTDKHTDTNHFAEVRIISSGPRTVKEARQQLFDIINKGGKINCPCCAKPANVQKEKFGRPGVVSLIVLVARYRLLGHGLELIYIGPGRNGIATMRYKAIDLVQPTHGIGGGSWVPTPTGEGFVFDKIEVPEGVIKYAKKVRGPLPDKVRVTNFLKPEEYKGALKVLRGEMMVNTWISTLRRADGRPEFSPLLAIKAETDLFSKNGRRKK